MGTVTVRIYSYENNHFFMKTNDWYKVCAFNHKADFPQENSLLNKQLPYRLYTK